jgi:hypothetical protein
MPIQINAVARTETKTVVRYETVEERRQAMIAKGWSPTVLADPRFITLAPADDHDLEAIALHVNADGEHAHLHRQTLRAVILESRGQRSAFEPLRRLFPRLAEHGVDPHLQQRRVMPRLQKLSDNLRQGQPRRQKSRNVKAGGAAPRALHDPAAGAITGATPSIGFTNGGIALGVVPGRPAVLTIPCTISGNRSISSAILGCRTPPPRTQKLYWNKALADSSNMN